MLAVDGDLSAEQLRPARSVPIRASGSAMSRAEAVRLTGMERQPLRDAAVRYNAEGFDGLMHRPKPGHPRWLTEREEALLRAKSLREPDPGRIGMDARGHRVVDQAAIRSAPPCLQHKQAPA